MKPHTLPLLLVFVITLVSDGSAQTSTVAEIDALRAEIDALKADYDQRLQALERQFAALQNQAQPAPPTQTPATTAAPPQTAEVPAGAQGASGPSGQLPVYGGATAGSKIFNPDIAVIGDFLGAAGAAGSNNVNPDPALTMHESEASFQAIVDPYARADFFFSFGEQGVNLEEGYLTFPA